MLCDNRQISPALYNYDVPGGLDILKNCPIATFIMKLVANLALNARCISIALLLSGMTLSFDTVTVRSKGRT